MGEAERFHRDGWEPFDYLRALAVLKILVDFMANITLKSVFRWVFIIIFGILGLAFLFTSLLAGIALLLAAATLLPQADKVLGKKIASSQLRNVKIVLIIVFVAVAGANLPESTSSSAPAPAVVAAADSQTSAPTTQATVETKPSATAVAAPAPAPTQPDLETTLKGIVAKATGTTDVNYRSIEVENDDDSDRPAGSKMLTVDVNVTSFYNRDAFIKDSGKLAAQLFQASIPSSLKPYDVFIWFHGETTDRYGNKKDSVITVYSIDKLTYAKINWSNFDTKTLCDFLKNEEKIDGIGTGPACNITANIQ